MPLHQPAVRAAYGLIAVLVALTGGLGGLRIEDVPHSHAAATRGAELAACGEVEAIMKGSLHTDELMAEVVAAAAGLRQRPQQLFQPGQVQPAEAPGEQAKALAEQQEDQQIAACHGQGVGEGPGLGGQDIGQEQRPAEGIERVPAKGLAGDSSRPPAFSGTRGAAAGHYRCGRHLHWRLCCWPGARAGGG